VIDRLQTEAFLGIHRIAAQNLLSATAFEGVFAVPWIAEEIAQTGQQETAEAAFLPFHMLEATAIQDVREECLCEVLAVMGAVATAADEGVNRIPVIRAKPLKGGARLFGVGGEEPGDHAPIGRRKGHAA
jgi:hypothetical protein